jgi:hypothetical protein
LAKSSVLAKPCAVVTEVVARRRRPGFTRTGSGAAAACALPQDCLPNAALFNHLNWPDGADGDVVAAVSTTASTAAPVRAGGVTDATLDVPATPGNYEVRAFITDPRNGAIRTVRTAITVR